MKTKTKRFFKRIVIGGLIIATLTVPVFRLNYQLEGANFEVRHYSVISSLAEDIKEKSFMTPDLVYSNIIDRSQEVYNDVVYK